MAMGKKEYASAIKALGLSHKKAADFLGISPRQSRRLSAGVYDPSLSQEKLLKVMLHCGLTPTAVNDICHVEPAKTKKKAAAKAMA